MNRNDIRNLFEYNDWANDVLIEMLCGAFGESTDLRSGVPVPVTRVQETAVHILGAANIWRLRWIGTSLTRMMDPAPYATPRALRDAYQNERLEFWRFFGSLDSDADLSTVHSYTNTRGEPFSQPLSDMMLHVVNHSSYHRGQITGQLITLGHEEVVASTDLATWTLRRAQ